MPKYTLVLRDSVTLDVEALRVVPDNGVIVFVGEDGAPQSIYKDFVSVVKISD